MRHNAIGPSLAAAILIRPSFLSGRISQSKPGHAARNGLAILLRGHAASGVRRTVPWRQSPLFIDRVSARD
jgi:hypothetical protein